jgi:hypothetical protein
LRTVFAKSSSLRLYYDYTIVLLIKVNLSFNYRMSDLFGDFSDRIEDNAGAYAALGGMAHLRNQNAQRNELRKQRALLEDQLASAKAAERTEKERLEIEKKRFEIEQKERDLSQKKAESVKEMRKVMSRVSAELEEMNRLINS